MKKSKKHWKLSPRKRISDRIRTGRYHAKKFGYAPPDVTIDQVIAAEKKQKGVCACCGEAFGRKGYNLDHDHKTGKFRGLLCEACNLVEGIAKTPERCEAVARYMRSNE